MLINSLEVVEIQRYTLWGLSERMERCYDVESASDADGALTHAIARVLLCVSLYTLQFLAKILVSSRELGILAMLEAYSIWSKKIDLHLQRLCKDI